ncbi:Fe-S cluster assembly protein SufD [Nitrospirillum iridis]|uniref:Fe-S cluster assembly protein SufD n=1 Tax=Nitrospirillum iridis TaxID=765888 RepID=A0A7X0B3T0_9PROT|nr:Fe-S cluster assembly protein SufD [Nitrospirillum iridis]MBB6254456.1 Fe-S cluster assembly protein SufD [Nitrospirillum iridis]
MLITQESASYQDAVPPGGQPPWLARHRAAGMARFAAEGYPKRSQEAWRFTDLRPLTASVFPPAPPDPVAVDAATVAPHRLPCPSHRLVLVNGRFAPALSDIGVLPEGVWLGSVTDALRERPDLVAASLAEGEASLAALNAALFADGFVLAVEAGVTLEAPVEVIHYADMGAPAAAHVRNRMVVGAGGRATVIETSTGVGAGWLNTVTVVTVATGGALRHVQLQRDAAEAIHTSVVRGDLAGDARYESFSLMAGGRLSRRDIQVNLGGPGASVALNGAYLLRGSQEATFAPVVTHAAPHCRTDEVVKGVMQDRAHGVFLGTVRVHPGADGTDARQLNRNLLLSPTAWVDTKPELEILADDVKCSHGATVGSLDEASLFYLQARGIDPATARLMLVEAFAADVIDGAGLDEPIRDHVHGHLRSWLDGLEGGR